MARGGLAEAATAARDRAGSPWLFGRRADLAVFGAPAAVGLAVAAFSSKLAPSGVMPGWAWIAFVLAVDVTHVHTMLFRTYFDRAELRKRPWLYSLLPVACWCVGAALYLHSDVGFWRALAYVAVFHFVRQQIGWVAIYRARAGETSKVDRVLDEAVIYISTLYPLAFWHAHLPRSFRWFFDGDFVSVSSLASALPALAALEVALLVAYVARAVTSPPNYGKHLVVASTALTWYVGIVATNDDLAFTACNVLVHGVPYIALLWVYTKARGAERPGSFVGRVAALGIGAFLGVALLVAFGEEFAWDRLVWHEAPPWFGGPARDTPLLGPWVRAFVVPLLAVPQATHYVLDAVLWRRKDAGPAQARALGFRMPRRAP